MSQQAAVEIEPREQLREALKVRIERCQMDLPLLPHVAAQVLAMAADEKSDASSLSALIHRDQALAGHVLRVANSAALAGSTHVATLQHAVARLGLDFLSGIVVALSVRSSVFRVPGFEAETSKLWRHALGSAVYAKEIARMRRRSVETAFLCGLLHNIGKPVVLKAAADAQKELRIRVDAEGVLLLVEELHGQAGALLAVKWTLPDPVVESIIYCSELRGEPRFADEAQTALLADRLTTLLLAPERDAAEALRSLAAPAHLNLYPDDLESLLERGPSLLEVVDSMSP